MNNFWVFGCSFVANATEDEHTTLPTPMAWPQRAGELLGYDVCNFTNPAGGNALFSRRLIHTFETLNIGADDMVIIQWTYPIRHEFFVSKKEGSEWNTNPIGIPNPSTFIGDPDTGWVITGGVKSEGEGGWANPRIAKWFMPWFRQYHTFEFSYISTYEAILAAQWYLERHNIKYLMLSWCDIFAEPQSRGFLNTRHLSALIDFDSWLFPPTYGPYGGFYEWCLVNKQPLPDHLHPYESVHKHFAETVICPHLSQRIEAS